MRQRNVARRIVFDVWLLLYGMFLHRSPIQKACPRVLILVQPGRPAPAQPNWLARPLANQFIAMPAIKLRPYLAISPAQRGLAGTARPRHPYLLLMLWSRKFQGRGVEKNFRLLVAYCS